MKSIKEKSENYVSGFHPSIQRMCKESFVDGANYVLEQIEKLLDEFSNFEDSLIVRRAIERLKSNQ